MAHSGDTRRRRISRAAWGRFRASEARGPTGAPSPGLREEPGGASPLKGSLDPVDAIPMRARGTYSSLSSNPNGSVRAGLAALGAFMATAAASVSPALGSPEFVQRAPLCASGSAPAGDASLASGWLQRMIEAATAEPITECEYFLLAPEGNGGGDAVGPTGGGRALIAQRRIVRGSATLLEREVLFEEGSLRVLHTERIQGRRRTLTYREIQPAGARTWLAEWTVDGGAGRILGHGWRRPTHEPLIAPRGLVGPLELLEGLRAGSARGPVQVLDPLAAKGSQLTAEISPGSRPGLETFRATRSDGTLLIEAEASAGARALTGLRFATGQRVGRPISRDEYERRHEMWNRPRIPAHQRVRAELLGTR